MIKYVARMKESTSYFYLLKYIFVELLSSF